jgi:hypothetical protein
MRIVGGEQVRIEVVDRTKLSIEEVGRTSDVVRQSLPDFGEHQCQTLNVHYKKK